MKIIRVDKCWRCPYCVSKYRRAEGNSWVYCDYNEDRPVMITDRFSGIPDWCPLEDMDEIGDDKEEEPEKSEAEIQSMIGDYKYQCFKEDDL